MKERRLSVAGTAADMPALIFDDRTRTWGEIGRLVAERVAALGSTRRPHAFVAKRDEQALLEILAAVEAGVPFAPLPSRSSPAEHQTLRRLVDSAPDIASTDVTDAAPLAYVFTSGSTGAPRAAVLSRGAFLAAAKASASVLPLAAGDRWLLAMPLSHVGGLSIVTRALHAGAAVVVAPEERWDPVLTVERISAHAVTHASFVPTMLMRMVAGGLRAPPSLRAVLVGGAPASVSLLEKARVLGWPVLPTYGLTEACSQVATRRLGDDDDRQGRIGRPLEGVEVRIVDDEIQVRGPTLFDGYLGEARAPFDEDGWLRTGDFGALNDDGVLEVVGRRDDLIITGGENVHPAEVEAALATHPAVDEVCVFGMPHPEWGQVVAAAVVTDAGADVLERFVVERLAAHRRPRRVFVVRALEKTASGKTDRAATRRALLSGDER